MKPIPYARQDVDDQDVQAVVEVLRGDWLTQGPAIEAFERGLAAACAARHAVAVSNGTAALHLACRALGLGPGDRLWTSPNTFVASANCALYCGAAVDFVDIDPRTYNLSVERLAEKLTRAERDGTLPKVVVPVHFAGQPCEMAAIGELKRRYGFFVLEDGSHALGGAYRGEPIGCGRHSDATVLSFHPVKIVTTGEGGAVVTNDPALAERVALLRTHGITRDAARMVGDSHGGWYYEQVELGFNYRITDLQAALGLSQLRRLEAFVAARHRIAARYDEAFAALPLTVPYQHPDGRSAYHLYPIRLRLGELGKTRREVFDALRARGILVNLHYIPVHTQPYYRRLGFSPGDFPEAERYYQEALSLPMFAGLSAEDQERVIQTLREVL